MYSTRDRWLYIWSFPCDNNVGMWGPGQFRARVALPLIPGVYSVGDSLGPRVGPDALLNT